MKTGSFEIQSASHPAITVRISWEETYNASTEKSTFSVTNLELKNTSSYGSSTWLDGFIQVEGKTLVSFNSMGGTHAIYTGALSTYFAVESPLEGGLPPWSAEIDNTDGTCSVVVDITGYETGVVTSTNGWRVTATKELSITEICTVTYMNPNGTNYATDKVVKGSAHTIRNSGPSKSDTTTDVTVTFNKNGGNNPSKTTEKATNKTSYTFNGWNTAADGSGTAHGKGASITVNSNLTLHPSYSSSVSYGSLTSATVTKSDSTSTRTVTFNANGGSCATSSLNSTKTDKYTCTGWYTAESGGTKMADSGGSMTPKTTQTVYAQWSTEAGTYSSITLPTATRPGHTFHGWSTSISDSSGITGSYVPSGNITLYAVWVWESNGLVYIDNGTSFDAYTIWIDNGSSWDQYIAYIDDGTQWVLLGGN